VAETSDIKAYLTFSKTIQGRFGCFKNQGFVKASLEFKTVAGTLQKCVFMKQESKKRHEHERTVISVRYQNQFRAKLTQLLGQLLQHTFM